jgi:hypothetical protein
MQYKNLLFDFYGGLLTEKQRACFTMHYMDDLSLVEIGDHSGITPQAVADLLKRSCALLNKYEEKLNLVEKLAAHKTQVEQVDSQLTMIAQAAREAGLDNITELIESIRLTVSEMVL